MQGDLSFEEKAARALDIGRAYLAVDNGHVTRIDEQTDYWETVVSTDPPDGPFPEGQVLDLRTTYCRRTIAADSTIALHDAPSQGWADDPAFETHGLHCYHGTTLTVDSQVYGTVCFVSTEPRERPFADDETMFAELVSRMLEHELEHARRDAELDRRSDLVAVFSRVIRHNLRNNMAVARGRVRTLMDQCDAADLCQPAVDKIDELIALCDTARKFEPVDGSAFDRRPVDLMALLEQIQTNLETQYPAASVTVAGPDEITVPALRTLGTAFEELVENAAKHTREAPDITVAVRADAEEVHVEVADDGPGLPEQEREVLRGRTETALIHGSGLGLWLAYWIVTNHDGTVQVDVTGAGTTITVSLPRRPDDVRSSGEDPGVDHVRDRFEAVFEEASDAMVLTDDQGRYVDANPASEDLFGLSREELLGRHVAEFVASDIDVDRLWQTFRAAGEMSDELTLVRPDGTERIVEFGATADVVPGQHLAVLRDVTERTERKRRYDALFNNTYQFMGLLDPDGTLLDANDPALEFGGLDPEDVIGKPVWETDWFRGSTDTSAAVRDAVERAAEGEFVRTELWVTGEDREVLVDFSVRPVRDEQGDVTLLVSEGRDITQLKAAGRVDSSAPQAW
jgi:PAS domain S-box-containing protein